MILFYLLGAAGVITGLYMVYSSLYKEKGVILPKNNKYGVFVSGPKKGQEWLLFVIGLVWTSAWVTMLLAALLGW